jgi:predicted Zn-dependent protease
MRFHLSRRLAAAVAVATALFLGSAAAASAYTLEGGRWGGTPTSGCCANIHVQYASSMYSIDRAGWDNARAVWNGSAANVYLTNASGALTVNDSYASTVAWDGITYLSSTSCGSSSCWTSANAYMNNYYTRSDSTSTIQGIAAHELGHAMGIGHASGCVLMTAATSTRNSCGIHGPTTDDVNGINRLY